MRRPSAASVAPFFLLESSCPHFCPQQLSSDWWVFFVELCRKKILSQKRYPKKTGESEASLPQLSSGKLNLVEKGGKNSAMVPQKLRCYRCVSRCADSQNDTASNYWISPFQGLENVQNVETNINFQRVSPGFSVGTDQLSVGYFKHHKKLTPFRGEFASPLGFKFSIYRVDSLGCFKLQFPSLVSRAAAKIADLNQHHFVAWNLKRPLAATDDLLWSNLQPEKKILRFSGPSEPSQRCRPMAIGLKIPMGHFFRSRTKALAKVHAQLLFHLQGEFIWIEKNTESALGVARISVLQDPWSKKMRLK